MPDEIRKPKTLAGWALRGAAFAAVFQPEITAIRVLYLMAIKPKITDEGIRDDLAKLNTFRDKVVDKAGDFEDSNSELFNDIAIKVIFNQILDS